MPEPIPDEQPDDYDVLHDGRTYKVYAGGDFPFRYTVTAPYGEVLTGTLTRRAALRAIRRDIRHHQREVERHARLAWWGADIVHRIDPNQDH